MSAAIHPVRLNHFNLVLENFEASVTHFADLFGAELLADIPNPETHACLIEIGRTIFEIFIPRAWLLSARYGPHFVGLEYQADMAVVRQAVAERGIRVVRDVGVALHTHPDDTLGVAFEFYDGYFHDRTWDALDGRLMHSASYWADEHPLGITGLKCWTLAVHDLLQASEFLTGFIGARPAYEAERSGIAARAQGLRVADDVIELLAPTGPGELDAHLQRYGEGIRSVVFAVRDLDKVRGYFADRGVALVAGSLDGALAIPATNNLGVIFEFAA